MILVTGAAGKTGRAVIEALAAKRVGTRAFTRNSEHARSLTALGATEVNIGGFEDPRALARAAAGAQAVYHICPNVSRDEVANARAVAAAARAQGVKRFVYHSVLHPQIEAMPHHFAKMRAEDILHIRRRLQHGQMEVGGKQHLLGAHFREVVRHRFDLRVQH